MTAESVFVLKPPRAAVTVDTAEVRRALSVLADPAAGCFVQGLPWAHWECLPGKDLDGLTAAVERIAGAKGTYFGLNPVHPGEKTTDKLVLSRRWMLLDWDSVPAHAESRNATAEEREEVQAIALSAVEYLFSRGFPPPVVIDSGNGTHDLYRIDLPNDRLAKETVRTILAHLAAKFDTERVELGVECCDARRISKLPGTWSCRGERTEANPGRAARLIDVPDVIEVVDAELLTALANEARGVGKAAPPQQAETPTDRGPVFLLRPGSERAYAKKVLAARLALIRMAPPGKRNDELWKGACRLGELLHWKVWVRQDVESQLFTACVFNRLVYDVEDGPDKCRDCIKRGLDQGETQPQPRPGEKKNTVGPEPSTNGQHKPESLIVWAHTITPRKVEWLWPGRIPLGKLTTFAGVGGLGKTFALLDISARVTAGMEWPFAGGEVAEAGRVLFVSGEDEPDDTLVPRLIECGADLSRVAFLKSEVQDRLTLADIPLIEDVLAQVGRDVRFVAIDPPTAFLGGVDDHKNAELRQLLSPLKSLAARHRVAIVFNTHVTKPQGAKVEAMMRVMGSVAWVNAVRAAHMFARDPNDHERRLFVGMKMNVGPEKKGLAYKLAITQELARIEWQGEVDTTADEAVNKDVKKRKVVASEWLAALFKDRDEVPSREIWDLKNDTTTMSDNALKEAKESMGIRARHVYDDDGKQGWVWHWPARERSEWTSQRIDKADSEEF